MQLRRRWQVWLLAVLVLVAAGIMLAPYLVETVRLVGEAVDDFGKLRVGPPSQ